MVHPGKVQSPELEGVVPLLKRNVGAEASRPPLQAETRRDFILPESPGMCCASGNVTCWTSCGLQAPPFSLPSNSLVLDVGAQEQEVLGETRQDRVVKASSTSQRCISDVKGGPHLGKHKLCRETRSVHKSCASVPKVSIKHSFCQLPFLRWWFICHFPSCCFLAGLINVLYVI